VILLVEGRPAALRGPLGPTSPPNVSPPVLGACSKEGTSWGSGGIDGPITRCRAAVGQAPRDGDARVELVEDRQPGVSPERSSPWMMSGW
jgi:hypothetical protein